MGGEEGSSSLLTPSDTMILGHPKFEPKRILGSHLQRPACSFSDSITKSQEIATSSKTFCQFFLGFSIQEDHWIILFASLDLGRGHKPLIPTLSEPYGHRLTLIMIRANESPKILFETWLPYFDFFPCLPPSATSFNQTSMLLRIL